MTNTIKEIIGKYKGDFIRIRQRIHKNPELGAKEFETQKFIIDELNKHGIKNYKCAETGVVGLIEGKNHESKEAKTILLRADMDALPINETTNAEFSSINPNVMHACGHDGHVANLLIAAFVLNDLKDKFYGNIKLMFQPAEESIGGCERMIKEGILKDPKVDYAVGLHVDADSDEGVITTKPGEWWASPDFFQITIIGKGGHGAIPHKTVDPINIAAQFILSAQNIITRKINVVDPVIMSFGKINGGDVFNAIPNEVEISGTVRTFSPQIRNKVVEEMEKFLSHICEMNGAKYKLNYVPYFMPLSNNEELVDKFKVSALKIIPKENFIIDKGYKMVGEDFSFLNYQIPSIFFMAGVHKKGTPTYSLHNSNFIFEEESLFNYATPILIQFALDLLE